MGTNLANLVALGLVTVLALVVVVMDFLDYLAERDFNRKHHAR